MKAFLCCATTLPIVMGGLLGFVFTSDCWASKVPLPGERVERPKLGRFFYNEIQRSQLEGNQIAIENGDIEEDGDVEELVPTMVDREIKVSGFVVRQDGSHVVWIDGRSELSQNYDDNDLIKGAPQLKDGTVTLVIDEKQRAVKPGQVWNVIDDEVQEAYNQKKAELEELTLTEISEIEKSSSEDKQTDNLDPTISKDEFSTNDIESMLDQISELQNKLDDLKPPEQ